MKNRIKQESKISRREFLKFSVQSGTVLGSVPLLTACSHRTDQDPNKEQRKYFFDLSHVKKGLKHYLIMGSESHELDICTSQTIALSENPLLQAISEGKITHHITHFFPSQEIQACYIRSVDPSDPEGGWSMSLSFFHLPRSSVEKAALREISTLDTSAKLAYYDLDASLFSGMELYESYVHEDAVKTVVDQAIDLTFHHPEILSAESDSAAHIQKNIIGVQAATKTLSSVLSSQGAATENGGWATLEPYINKKTGKPYLNSQGKIQYFPRYSHLTNTYLGNAVNPSLESVKNDVTLGVNITDLDPTVKNPSTKGKLWTINNGFTTVETMLESTNGSDWMTCSNKSKRHGYQATLLSADKDTGKITFKVENWYYRYLGIYIQFLDSGGNKISLKDIPKSTIESFASGSSNFDSTYNKYALMLASQFNIFGIPVKTSVEEITFIWPENATFAKIIAGGLGQGKEEYENTIDPGGVLTGVINLGIPTIFLTLGAATGFFAFASDMRSLEGIELTSLVADIIIELALDGVSISELGANPELFIEVGKTLGEFLLSRGITILYQKLTKYLTEGEITDAVPAIGKILATIAAAGLIAEIVTTSDEVLNSPANYSDLLTATHNIEVTIHHDPDDPNFPAVADYYKLTAMFDNGTPHDSGKIKMPGSSVSNPIKYTFENVPYGGLVSIKVTFNANKNDWPAGGGYTGSIENTVDEVEITIKENKVPLDNNTTYGHKQKIVLDGEGNHIWEATSTAPSETADALQCESTNGNLCQLTGITVSEHYGTLGYDWKSYSSDVLSCESSGSGQLFQLSTLSFTQDPQNSYTKPSCGSTSARRIIFDLMDTKNNNYYLDTQNGKNLIRQVRLELDGKPSIDEPDSNICWGKFTLPSDVLLLHPSRKLVSISKALNKIEILDLPEEAATDEDAPIAVAYSGRGKRHGLISGPVAAAISPQGVILVLESGNKRVQAFDTGINPAPYFQKNYHFPLVSETESVVYTDIAMESTGYIYILSYTTASYIYRLDIYDKGGKFISRTTGVNAAKLTVDLWRNVFTLNYEVLKMPNGTQPTITEPSVSQWIPSVP